MILAAMWTVMARSLLKATIGLAVTSAAITVLLFMLQSPLAAIFELSVCAGLITVIFISTISLTRPMTHQEIKKRTRYRNRRFWYLPVFVVFAAGLMYLSVRLPLAGLPKLPATDVVDPRNVLWGIRQLDLFGQIIIIVSGALGIAVLFSGWKEKT
jgi:NADH-quinone oxidoreductase subunit J